MNVNDSVLNEMQVMKGVVETCQEGACGVLGKAEDAPVQNKRGIISKLIP